MAGNDYEFPYELDTEQDAASSHSVISIEQLRRLVRALDSSDVSELELQRESDGVYLALRKVKASEMNVSRKAGWEWQPPMASQCLLPPKHPRQKKKKRNIK